MATMQFLNNQDVQRRLAKAIRETPIIDNHAHPLLRSEYMSQYPLLSIVSEAHGHALHSSRTSLAHYRAVNQLAGILRCEATWDAVSSEIDKRREGEAGRAWVQRCLRGIQSVLVDDGLDEPKKSESYTYFDRFTAFSSKRIVRIEYEATQIIQRALIHASSPEETWNAVESQFVEMVEASIQDPAVVGFKSVICYRTGLNIPAYDDDDDKVRSIFRDIFYEHKPPRGSKFERLAHPGLNERFVHLLAMTIENHEHGWRKPIQFHTGLGDNDITLTTSSPSHLQTFIREHPTVPIVLLHSSYPFTREAGYLAAMYDNVYADIGEVFPFLSRDGQLSVVQEILELCPTSKILWSTDGHWFPETYLLAVEQVYDVLETALTGLVNRGDLSFQQAVHLVEDIFFNNSNKLYNLGLNLEKLEASQTSHGYIDDKASSIPASDSQNYASAALSRIGADKPQQFLSVVWLDLMAIPRTRLLPMRRVHALLSTREDFSINIAQVATSLLQNDSGWPGLSPTGVWNLFPAWSSLRKGYKDGHFAVRGHFKELDGTDVKLCPRSVLQRVLDAGKAEGLEFMLGFEIELVLMRRTDDGFRPLDTDSHAWSTVKPLEHDAAAVLEEAIMKLDDAGIYVELMHAESAPGQFEIVLPKKPAMEAVDTLLHAREVISACATARGYKMTLHPKPFPNRIGTAAHVHMSISSPNGDQSNVYERFYAGILKHLWATLAFTCSSVESYTRIVDGFWAGGTWVAWGTENKEMPLRKIADSHWEIKCMDGMANPYLGLTALLGTGIAGYVAREELKLKDCRSDPSSLSDEERRKLGITKRLPRALSEALEMLSYDAELSKIMGEELVDVYIKAKRAEMTLGETMSKSEKREWVIERY